MAIQSALAAVFTATKLLSPDGIRLGKISTKKLPCKKSSFYILFFRRKKQFYLYQ